MGEAAVPAIVEPVCQIRPRHGHDALAREVDGDRLRIRIVHVDVHCGDDADGAGSDVGGRGPACGDQRVPCLSACALPE